MATARYANREHAGRVLAGKLPDLGNGPFIVVGIPRGGVVVAAPIADRLHCPLTLTFARKIALAIAPELAVGAMDEDGHVIVDHSQMIRIGGRPEDLALARDQAGREIRRQRAAFHSPRIEEFLTHSTVVLVDDGLATGYTMRAALAHARRHGARNVVVAVPCASRLAAETIRREADEFVCPMVDTAFGAVGTYYAEFPSVTDEEVASILVAAAERGPQVR